VANPVDHSEFQNFMPIYEYEDERTGRVVELSRPMRLRDDCPPHLQRVISRIGRPRTGRAGLADPSQADQAVPRALRELECSMSTAEVERQTGFSAKEMKRIWKMR
jgi:hypothetical protein